MTILGIDTSCDDTCIAVLEIKNKKIEIKSNIISSQVKLHAKYGGVYPSLAKREHQKNLPIVFKKTLRQTQGKEVDLIGVTVGPGLEPCLWQGINFAKELAGKFKKPLIPVNHIEAHILANWLMPICENSEPRIPNPKKIFPAICLIVSGGHTQLILMQGIGKYKLIGETRDDAAGECFDKTARILGLGYPGGPIVAKLAAKYKIQDMRCKIELPRPMIYQKNYDFSFSGLKTAVLYEVKSAKRKAKSEKYIRAMCHEVQQAIIDVLIHKTFKAAKDFRVKTVILGGGVAANEELRKQFNRKLEIVPTSSGILDEIGKNRKFNFLVPPKNLCTDNAAMIAITASFHQKEAEKNWQKIKADANLKI